MTAHGLIFAAELVGIVAFAISGALVAIEHELDPFGAVVLGTVTSVGGGIIRDVLLGHTPPVIFTDPIFALLAVAVSAAVFVFAYFFGHKFNYRRAVWMQIINFFDALGLGVFITVGVDAVLATELAENAFLAIFIGTLTGIGGGMLRDQLVCTVPVVLRKRIYALAALLGSALYYYLILAGCPTAISLPVAVAAVVTVRMLASIFRWNLPHVPK